MPQDLYQIIRDLLDQIIDCLEDPCPYQVFVSRGYPPADCSSIAGWYARSRRNPEDNGDCATLVYDTTLNFTVTHCCITPDQGKGFDFAREEIEAQCFLTNLAAIRECLSCNATTAIDNRMISCGALVTEISADPEAHGGCYSATISLVFEDEDCCS